MGQRPNSEHERTRSTRSEARLAQELGRLEEAATDAVVPGELNAWCEELSAGIDRTLAVLRPYGAEEGRVREQILREDLELGPRVDALEKAFAGIAKELVDLRDRTRALISHDQRDATTSAEPTGRVEELRKRALQWIVDLRAHQGEVETFLLESVYRDRGVGD